MEVKNQRVIVLLDALKTLNKGINLFYKYEEHYMDNPTLENQELFQSMRDSMIQRFEYCTDLFWKAVKVQLEQVEKVEIAIQSPRGVLREAVNSRLLSEKEAERCMKMVESRNRTSHIYHEIMAEEIAAHIPEYYTLITDIIDRF